MALTPILKPPFPSVPELPGVPVLQRQASLKVLSSELRVLTADSRWRISPDAPQWGIFTTQGKLLIEADSVLDIGFKQDHKISSYPIQSNAFNSYNKVAEPFQATVRLMKGGQLKSADLAKSSDGLLENQGMRERGDFLEAIDQASKSLDLYQVVTPERSYLNCNITSYAYRREQNKGAYQIVVDLTLEEVRQVQVSYAATASNSISQDTQDAGAIPTVMTGKVQAQPYSAPPQQALWF